MQTLVMIVLTVPAPSPIMSPGPSITPGISEGGAIVLGIVGLLTAVVSIFGPKLYQSVKAIRHQVENNHTTNLREESDSRHDDIKSGQSLILRSIEALDRRLGRMDERQINTERRVQSLEARELNEYLEIERTRDHPPRH